MIEASLSHMRSGGKRQVRRCDGGDNRHDSGRALAWFLAIVVLLAGSGYGAYYFGYLDRFLCESGDCSALDVLPPEDLAFPPARSPEPVLTAADGSPLDAAKVEAALRPLLTKPVLGKHVGFAVHDLGKDRAAWSYGTGSFTPASTLKLFTSLAAMSTMDPDRRFETKVVRSDDGPGGGDTADITIVGGGDPLLATRSPKASDRVYPQPATLAALAARTAKSLQDQGLARVRLSYDVSMFTGPVVNARWEPQYVTGNVTTPVSALWADEGVLDDKTGVRSRTPGLDAAKAFARALKARSITVQGGPAKTTGFAQGTSDGSGDGSGVQLASVSSPTLTQIVQHLLESSDNESAEVLLRHVAMAAGEEPSFDGGVRAMRGALTGIGVPWTGNTIYDGSGLARGNKVTTASMLSVLAHAADADNAPDRAVVTDLPIAGFNGSLTSRFAAPGTDAGLGVVRAKTGTLTGVHSLAGLTRDRSGTPVAFVVLTDKVKLKDTLAARATLDRIAARLAACACSR